MKGLGYTTRTRLAGDPEPTDTRTTFGGPCAIATGCLSEHYEDMVLEHALLDIIPGGEAAFEEAFAEAKDHKCSGGFSVVTAQPLCGVPAQVPSARRVGQPRTPYGRVPWRARVPKVAQVAAPILRAVPRSRAQPVVAVQGAS